MYLYLLLFFFFFQAEDGIRDDLVTGVQTCALPIFERRLLPREHRLLMPLLAVLGAPAHAGIDEHAAAIDERRIAADVERLDGIVEASVHVEERRVAAIEAQV